jgi:glycosyltransferase involved in cell wall biosynthesis
MKIAFVSDVAFPWHPGGVESTERDEAEALAKHHDVHFFSFRWKGMKKEFTDKGINYHCSHYLTDNELYKHNRRSIREAFYFSLVCLRLFSQRFDVVQVNAFPILHLPLIKFYCKLTKCRLIMDVADVWDKKYWIEYIGRFWGTLASIFSVWAMRGADIYISNPEKVYKSLIMAGAKKEKVHVFSPIINNSAISSVKAKGRRGLVVSIGRLVRYKRFDSVIYSVKEAFEKYDGIRCTIVGKGPEKKNLTELVKKLGVESVVKIKGRYRDKSKLYSLIKSASLMLNLSEREGLSVITLESLALGTPVLLPSYSTIPDVVKEMCVVCDIDDMPSTIAKICRSSSKHEFIKNRSNLELFRISNINNFYNDIFKQLGMHE